MFQDSWEEKYVEILNEFGYTRTKEIRSAKILNWILKNDFQIKNVEEKIKHKTVFVIGAGPSLKHSLSYIKKFKNITKIVADGATQALIENGIKPDIVVTDLDGNMDYLKQAAESGSIMIVHAHGDNIRKLPHAVSFRYCLGTTEDKPFSKIRNFGGFTDGDRCVFLADNFDASKIILIGMDFGTKVGEYSKDNYQKATKLKKLKRGKELLEWLASKSMSDLYTTTKPILGFKKIRMTDLQRLVRS